MEAIAISTRTRTAVIAPRTNTQPISGPETWAWM
jgi:hypothetical protein